MNDSLGLCQACKIDKYFKLKQVKKTKKYARTK